MKCYTHLLVCLATSALASPLPQGTGSGADSCRSQSLEPSTWTDLDMDTFLTNWIEANVSAPASSGNHIQALASSFGAPNFFCGLDAFCNAGQPCLPVSLPGWYAMVAIQNWNNYMNSINTAINFASSIISLTLPGIVEDFLPKPVDNVTPLISFTKMFTTVLGVVPLTGAVGTGRTVVNGGLNFLVGQMKPPTEADKFVAWSNVAGSLAGVVKDYQASVSSTFTRILNTEPLDPTSGIAKVVSGGEFLGVTQNFTQADLQQSVTDTITRFALGHTIAANKVYVLKFWTPQPCLDDDVSICVRPSDGDHYNLVLKQDNWDTADDAARLLRDKYGMAKEDYLTKVIECWESNGNKNYADPFEDAIPLDASTNCVFNLPVCELRPGELAPGAKDYRGHCRQIIAA